MSRLQELPSVEQSAPVHELFELHAEAAPDAVALHFRDERLTYGELNARANRLAHWFTTRGLQPGDRVVVAVEPSFEVVIALLAIWKVRAVYVPLDPTYPAARIRSVLDDASPRLVVTQSWLTPRLQLGVETLELDRPLPQQEQLEIGNLGMRVAPEQSAYVFYTSGTTGTPKGIVASHANLACYVGSAVRRYGFSQNDVCPAIARFSFSISLFELVCPLVAGGSVFLLERAHVLDFARLSRTLRQVTLLHAGPSLLRGLLQYISRHEPDVSVFSGVRHASTGGDMVPVEVLEGLRTAFQRAEIFVIYGCSEISCMGTTYAVPRDEPLPRTYVGHAFEGVTVRVVDDQLVDLPPGAIGEVLFAGPGLVKGYLGRPELTAEKFLQQDGQRWYRTGDRGRFDEQGRLELLGRSDFQIKLGGIRIEPAEIEHHLRRAPGVENAVVAARELGHRGKVLVAYVVLDPEAGSFCSAPTIRSYLAEQLPDYMVPSLYVVLPALPLNHNAKVDRNALPEPTTANLQLLDTEESTPPSTPTERRLAEIWRSALGAERVGVNDTFFDLGGTSLSALQLIATVDRELGVRLTGLELLREPLGILSRLVDERSGKASVELSTAGGAKDQLCLFHFGAGGSLFGALHGPPGPAPTAALICGPVGHEQVRAHFVLQRLARQLGAAGMPTLRFDYYGCQDSLGDSDEASCVRWQRDIVAAYAELKRRTEATRVVAIGVRLGASLLRSVLLPSLQDVRVVQWDPIDRPGQYLDQLMEAHREYVRTRPGLRQRLRARWPGGAARELLGARYSRSLLNELRRLPPTDADDACLRTDCAWLDLARLEDMLPDEGISRVLARLALEAR
jgi:amino acid adenylation domain-containing protein